MYESRRSTHRNHFRARLDPVMLAILFGAVLLVCGILIGHAATSALSESAAEIQTAIYQ